LATIDTDRALVNLQVFFTSEVRRREDVFITAIPSALIPQSG
jgi:hypothetical protein